MRVLAFAVAALCVAGCASDQKEQAPASKAAASSRDLELTIGSGGLILLASASGGALRITNTGGESLSVCDDNQCFLLDPGKDMQLTVNGKCTFHLSSAGAGEGRAEAHLLGGGDSASVKEQ